MVKPHTLYNSFIAKQEIAGYDKHLTRSELKWDDMGGITNTTWDRLFACPTVGHGAGDWKQVDYWTDYRLIPGRTTNDPIDTVLAIEPLSNHKTGANVLFVDGSSQWWPAKRVLNETAIRQSANN